MCTSGLTVMLAFRSAFSTLRISQDSGISGESMLVKCYEFKPVLYFCLVGGGRNTVSNFPDEADFILMVINSTGLNSLTCSHGK